MEVVATFAERLKEAMYIRNVRARDITENTGISSSQISHYLKGDYNPKQPTVTQLSHYLRVNEVWLIGYNCNMERYEPTFDGTLKEIFEMCETLSNNDLQCIKNFIKNYFINR